MTATAHKAMPYRGIVSISAMMATTMQAIDSTIANVALPHMQASLSATPDQTCGGTCFDLGTLETTGVARDVDGDEDGFSLADDCDDADASVHPGATDTCADGVDRDCDGLDCADSTAPVCGFPVRVMRVCRVLRREICT